MAISATSPASTPCLSCSSRGASTHATVQSIALRSLLRALSCCEAAKDSRAPSCTRFEFGQLPIRSRAATRSSMVWAPPQARQLKQRDVGMLQAEISSFRLHLAAGGKSAKTIRTYTELGG